MPESNQVRTDARNNAAAAVATNSTLNDFFRCFADHVKATAGKRLRARRTRQMAVALVHDAHRLLAEALDLSPDAPDRACVVGCSLCCHTVPVDVTPVEALVIARHLKQELDERELALIQERLAVNVERRRGMTFDQHARARLRCGFLTDEGLCSIYSVRPLACAGAFSLAREACEAAFEQRENLQAQVPTDRPARLATMGVSGGLQAALAEAGLDGNLYELQSAVQCALETPKALDRWLRKEDIFAECICTEGHSPPRARVDQAGKSRPKGLTKRGSRV